MSNLTDMYSNTNTDDDYSKSPKHKFSWRLFTISVIVTLVGGAAIIIALLYSHVFDEDFPNRNVSNVATTSNSVKTTEPLF